MLELNKIHNMDCIEGMKLLEENSIDSIVTDPPYELGFMNKGWDKTGIAYNVDMWKECLRVLKPGGCLLSFGGSRTYHRMACAIEDAGFEIRDQIMWLYGSGFPKSMDISKAIDKKAGAERTEGAREWKGGRRTGYIANSPETNLGTQTLIKYDKPVTELAEQWNGWGTALKPAHEPIVVARKPLSEKTVTENVLKWGTGGININDCRVPVDPEVDDMLRETTRGKRQTETWENGSGFKNEKNNLTGVRPEGRFPANIILDEEAGIILDEQSGTSKSNKGKPRQANIKNQTRLNNSKQTQVNCEYGDKGGASRFFYCAKTSKKERGEGNNHPTVKPLTLIKYLITLVTPPNGMCLDPFIGSGSTAIACLNLDFQYIGFELNPEYIKIAENRIKNKI